MISVWRLRTSVSLDALLPASVLGPIILLLAFAAVLPFVVMLGLSFTDFSFTLPGRDGAFLGFANYIRAIFVDDRFHSALGLQLAFLGATVPLELMLGLFCAAILRKAGKQGRWVLPLYILPLLLAPITVGIVWRLLLHGDYGPIGYLFVQLTGSSILGDPTNAFLAIIAVDVWQWTPFFTLIIFSARYRIPEAPIMAAQIDGATPGRIFWTVTLPLLRPAVTVALLIRVMDSFKEFDKVFALTRGGPASATELVSVYTWIVSFEHGDVAYGSAITVFIYLGIYLASSALFRAARKDWS